MWVVSIRAIRKFAVDTRKMLFRYSQLCGTAFDAVDAVKLRIALKNDDYPALSQKIIRFLEDRFQDFGRLVIDG